MKPIADLHTHTLASTHAFSTLNEIVQQAQKLGLKALAITDHAVALDDAPHISHFNTLLRLPDIVLDNFLLLKGAEVNILDHHATLDLDDTLLRKLDWVVASLHRVCIEPLSFNQATEMWLKIAANPYVDVIGHSEEEVYKYDYDFVTQEFSKQGKIVEMNASSSVARPGNEENMRNLALACKKNQTCIAVNSDAHSVYNMGNWDAVFAMLQEISFPPELIVNTSMQRLLQVLKQHGRGIANRLEKIGYTGAADGQH